MVDTNVVIDLLERDAVWSQWSEDALLDAAALGDVAISAIVAGELARRFPSLAVLDTALAGFGLRIEPLDAGAAFLAGEAFGAYRASGGSREKLLGDFLIGGHALRANATLLTRDPRPYRRYFPDLLLVTPETDHD
jgi:predicted nucleic acid-binding protein